MFYCVIYVCENLKSVVPMNWIYENPEHIIGKKHYFSHIIRVCTNESKCEIFASEFIGSNDNRSY